MSLKLQAPLPEVQTTTLLPNPQLTDVASRRHEFDIFRAIDGTKRTSVKSDNRQQLSYTFLLNPLKAEELKRFIQSYYRSKIRLINHKNEIWEGWLTSNPVSFSAGAKDQVSVQILFEGTKVS